MNSSGLPQSGVEYLASLDDGRRIGIDGGIAAQPVTEHPAFEGVAQTIANMYDALHGAESAQLLAATEDGGKTHASFAIPRSRDDLRRQRGAIRAWHRIDHGFLGRSPDSLGAIWTAMGADPAFFGEHEDAARSWFARTQKSALHFAHALIHPPVDRSLGPDAVRDVFVHVEAETDTGLVVSGAKVVATGAATAQRILVGHFGADVATREFAIMFVADPAADGVTLHARAPYATQALAGNTANRPLSARFDENDTIVVFTKTLIPWEDVLIYDVDTMRSFNTGGISWSPRLAFQAATRLEAKLELIIGLVANALQITGSESFRGVQASLGELIAFRHEVAGLRDGMIEGMIDTGDFVIPNPAAALAFAAAAPESYSRMRVTIQTIVASGLVHLPSTIDDLTGPLGGVLASTLRGSGGISADERVRTMKALWDAIGTEFGARQELYERSYWGQSEKTHLGMVRMATDRGQLATWQELAKNFTAAPRT